MVRETVGAGAGEDLGHDRVEADGWMLRGQEWTAAAEAAADPVMLTTVLVSDASDTPVCVRNGGEPVTPGRVGDPPTAAVTRLRFTSTVGVSPRRRSAAR